MAKTLNYLPTALLRKKNADLDYPAGYTFVFLKMKGLRKT